MKSYQVMKTRDISSADLYSCAVIRNDLDTESKEFCKRSSRGRDR